jgi:hypothetical protein
VQFRRDHSSPLKTMTTYVYSELTSTRDAESRRQHTRRSDRYVD